jgi:nucleotide-binding universal stress UspA family protein
MQRFKKILVVIDENTKEGAVVERAIDLACRNDAHLSLVSIVDRPSPNRQDEQATEPMSETVEPSFDIIEDWPPTIDLASAPEQPPMWAQSVGRGSPEGDDMPASLPDVLIRESVLEAERQRLEQWADVVQQRDLSVETRVLSGVPFLEIIREVLRQEHDLVMTTAKGRSSLRERFFGSTTMHLMRKCPCPVWVVKRSQPERQTRILAAVEPNPQDQERHALSVKIMDLATSLARQKQSELIVVHAWFLAVERSLRSGHVNLSDEVDRWVADTRRQHRQWLVDLVEPYSLEELKHEVYLLKGEAGRLIPEVAVAKDAQLIVMGTVSRTGVSGLLIGNTAEKILGQVDCGVLAVKPDGFVTPVRLDE